MCFMLSQLFSTQLFFVSFNCLSACFPVSLFSSFVTKLLFPKIALNLTASMLIHTKLYFLILFSLHIILFMSQFMARLPSHHVFMLCR